MKQLSKRLLSLLLCAVLVAGLLPAAALAADLPFEKVTLENATELSAEADGTMDYWGNDIPVYGITVPAGTDSALLYDGTSDGIFEDDGYGSGCYNPSDLATCVTPIKGASPYTVPVNFEQVVFIKQNPYGSADSTNSYILKWIEGAVGDPSAAPVITTDLTTAEVSYTVDTPATALSVTATGASLTYQWHMSTTSATEGFTKITSATDPSHTPSTEKTGDFWYKVTVTNTEPDKAPAKLDSAVAHIKVNAPEGKVLVTIKTDEDAALTLTAADNAPVALPAPAAGVYTAWLAPGNYAFEAKDGERLLGSGTFTITNDPEQTFTFALVWVYPGSLGWAAEEFTTKVTDANDNVMMPGAAHKFASYVGYPYLLPSGESYTCTVIPSADKIAQGYAETSISKSISATSTDERVSLTLYRTAPVTFTVPVGATLTVSKQGEAYALPAALSPISPDGTAYSLTENQTYLYRVTAPNKVTYAKTLKVAASTFASGVTVTDADLAPVGKTPGTIDRDLTANSGYNVADLLLNVNSSHSLSLAVNGEYQLLPMRMWQTTTSKTNSGTASGNFVEPDFHYTVIDEIGAPSSVVTVDETGLITAKSAGTAIVLVTYDAITAPDAVGGSFFGAIWPESTGVVVVTVGEGAGPDTGMTLNTDNVGNKTHKLSGDALDAELDPLYYTGDSRAYTFTPPAGSAVTLLRPTLTDSAMTFSGGFDDTGVTVNPDQSVTLSMTEGRNIVKVMKGGASSYQVVTVKRQSAPAVTNLTTPGAPIQPGNQVQVVLDAVYLPANRMVGLYNFTSRVTYKGGDGKNYSGAATSGDSKYKLQTTASARTLTLTIPADWDTSKPYSLTNGVVEITGHQGQVFGNHRMVTKDGLPSATASTRTGALGALPDIAIPVQSQKLFTITLEVEDSAGAALDGYTAVFYKNGVEAGRTTTGSIALTYGDYEYAIYKSGYQGYYGTLTLITDSAEQQILSCVMGNITLESGWDGLTLTQPTKSGTAYQIGTGAELAWFADWVNKGNAAANAVLTADIDLAGYRWTPIGVSASKLFKGNFDGGGHSIYNLRIDINGGSIAGFFGDTSGYGAANGIEIKNLTLASGSMNIKTTKSGDKDYGALVGRAESKTNISNCVSKVDITVSGNSTAPTMGGLVGYLYGATLTNCQNYGAVTNTTGGNDIGGLAGHSAMASAAITDCANYGDITSNGSRVGGIISYTGGSNATLLRCANYGDVTGKDSVGGISGMTGSPLNQCFNTGRVTGTTKVGGITGVVYNGTSYADIYNTGAVTGENVVGGLIGDFPASYSLTSAYSTGAVSAPGAAVGAVIGQTSGTLSKIYYLGLSGSSGIGSGTPTGTAAAKSPEELKRLTSSELSASYTSDAANINGGYPILVWQANVTALKIATKPTKLTYTEGDTLELAGMVVKGTVGGREITLDNAMLTVTPKVLSSKGAVTVTVAYRELKDTFTVQVNAYIPPDPAEISIETTLTDGMSQKGSRRTFDVIAYDKDGEKISAESLTVKLNGSTIDYNWNDDVKTSYTLNFTKEGENTVTIKALTKTVTYTIHYTKAQPGEVIGQAVFAVEAFTVGGGYIVTPQYVDIIEGENGAALLTHFLEAGGYGYKNTGATASGFYLSAITGSALAKIDVTGAGIPKVLRDALPYSVSSRDHADSLGEFDYTQGSGWMYCANNTFPNVGFSDNYPADGDVIRIQYTLAYGADIGGGYSTGGGGSGYYTVADKDALTTAIAEKGADKVPQSALDTAAKLNATRKEVEAAIKAIETAGSANGATENGKKDEVVTELKPTATVDKNGVAKAEVTGKDVENAIASAKKDGATSIVIEPTVKGNAGKVSVELPKDSVAAIGKDTTAKLTVKTTIAEISIPNSALSELAKGEGTAVAISAETVKSTDGRITGEIRLEVMVGDRAVETVKGGLTVALPVTKATAGTVLMLVTDEGAKIIKKSAVEGSTLSALLSGSATVMVKENAGTFADVDANHWGRDAVAFASSHELFQGTGANTFEPAGDMSRAMLFTVLARMEEQGGAAGNTWYESSMLWAKEQGISDGASPESSITREQLAAMLYRYAESLGVDTTAGGNAVKEFSDRGNVSAWATDAMAWCVGAGLLNGKSGSTLDPAGTASRAEVAAVLQRFMPLLLR